MMYFLYCKQRGMFVEDWDDEKLKFKTQKAIKEWLIEYHSIDSSEEEIEQLKNMKLKNMAQMLDWEIVKKDKENT
jgi:hypothetical protein